jgi:hypothetical protein
MKTFRIVFGVLAIIPITLLIGHISIPPNGYAEDSLFLVTYLVLGIPIFVLNYWAWIDPGLLEFLFFGKELK